MNPLTDILSHSQLPGKRKSQAIVATLRQAIRQYCEVGSITTGALFRRIRRSDNITSRRLSVQGARNAIKRRAHEVGVEGFISNMANVKVKFIEAGT